MRGALHRFGKLLQRKLLGEDWFWAPRAFASTLHREHNLIVIEENHNLGTCGRALAALLGAFFLPILVVDKWDLDSAPRYAFILMTSLLLFAALAPSRKSRIEITPEGVTWSSWLLVRGVPKQYSVERIVAMRIVRQQLHTESGPLTNWAAGVVLESGETIGIIADMSKSWVEAIAEEARAILQRTRRNAIPLGQCEDLPA